MKKLILCTLFVLLLASCESKYEKSVRDLESNIWIIDDQKLNNSITTDIVDKNIHRFTDGDIYVYDLLGNPLNVFEYEKVDDNGNLKIIVENIYSHKKQRFSVVVSDFQLVMINTEDGNLTQTNYHLLKDSTIIKKIIENNF